MTSATTLFDKSNYVIISRESREITNFLGGKQILLMNWMRYSSLSLLYTTQCVASGT